MKRLFSKFFEEPNKNDELIPAITLPQLAELNSFKEVQKRALIGWIVYRMAEVSELNSEQRNALFYQAFTITSFEDIMDETTRNLFHVASLAVEWLQSNALIEEEMKGLNLSKLHNDALSRVLSEVHSETILNRNEIDESKKVWEVYRDVIYAATQGGFLLIEKDKVEHYMQGELLCETLIQERADIPKARNLAKSAFEVAGLKVSKMMSYNLIVSEAVTNILKHAEHGKMFIYKDQDVFRVIVEDKGPGFSLKLLPKTTLMAGFSTKESLGQGFTLMMKIVNQVVLETSSNGSTLILILDRAGDERNDNDRV
ncbi:ATP-binding protein [Bacillus sp. Marseille-P3661]|uniref:ATP-binding protein n=1 Tax=Bacillus sp. Marseille-P3661 TaxID=1936234 RepID=UPI000C8380B6|nr:ATP-binding protein [Bacillus sp. Marseille-P3661]